MIGDIPIFVAWDSADVWVHREQFQMDDEQPTAVAGVPPDAFSETGQDWGLPPWRAHVMREGEFRWMKNRARRYAGLYHVGASVHPGGGGAVNPYPTVRQFC